MAYYRLQSNHYEVTPETKVTTWSSIDMLQAMKRDIEERWRIIISDDANVEEIWNNGISEGKEGYYCLPGVSCCELPEELIEYFDCEGRDKLDEQTGYILVFEGEFKQYGTDGEDVVKFEKEIERMTIESFIEKYAESYKEYIESGMCRFGGDC